MYSVKGAENTLFYSTDLEWFRCILKVQNKMTPDVLKNVFASRFKADVVSVLEEKHYCLQLNNEMFLVFSTSVKKKKKKIHWLASESLSCFMCETPLHQHGHCAKSPEVKSVCNCVQTRRRKCAYSLSNPQLGLKTTTENKCWHCTFRQTTRYTFILCSDNAAL